MNDREFDIVGRREDCSKDYIELEIRISNDLEANIVWSERSRLSDFISKQIIAFNPERDKKRYEECIRQINNNPTLKESFKKMKQCKSEFLDMYTIVTGKKYKD